MEQMIYTVTIQDFANCDAEAWVSSFSSKEKAMQFADRALEKLKKYGVSDHVQVVIDCGELDSDEYLGWIDESYGN